MVAWLSSNSYKVTPKSQRVLEQQHTREPVFAVAATVCDGILMSKTVLGDNKRKKVAPSDLYTAKKKTAATPNAAGADPIPAPPAGLGVPLVS